jgi:hypothetical protein
MAPQYAGIVGPVATLRIHALEPLGAAAAAFRGLAPLFDAAALEALASADPEHDRRIDPAYREAVVPFYASSVLGERAAADSCRRAVDDAPAPLRAGFLAQAIDEERHARLDETRLAQLGVDPATAPDVTPGVASEMRASAGEPDPLRRMFVTNFIGETALAGATFPFVIELARANGDRLSVALNRARLADESRHVRFAERAFSVLVAQDEENLRVLQRWQDEHFAIPAGAFVWEVAPYLDAAPHRPAGDWLGRALDAYRARAERLGLRPPPRP